MIVLLVMTDGRRDCIERTIASAEHRLAGPITWKVIHDDSGDERNRRWLRDTFPDFDLIFHPQGRQGFGGAIRTAWGAIGVGKERFVFHLEDDFVFERDVDLLDMARVLDANRHLAQLVLKGQPWNDSERAAGGIVEQHPGDYADCGDGQASWLEHRRFWSTNPSLYRRSMVLEQWPTGSESEGRFSHRLLQDGFHGVDPDDVRFAFWGERSDAPWVTHIGHERAGVGY